MLSDAANREMSNGTGKINVGIAVVVIAMGPTTMKLINPKHDTQEINPDLGGMFSIHEAQKFQAVEWDIWVNHPPKFPNCAAVDSVNHTVTVPLAKDAICVFPESVFGEPPMEARSK